MRSELFPKEKLQEEFGKVGVVGEEFEKEYGRLLTLFDLALSRKVYELMAPEDQAKVTEGLEPTKVAADASKLIERVGDYAVSHKELLTEELVKGAVTLAYEDYKALVEKEGQSV